MISTLVSLSKRAINEEIPGMQRANYHIPAAKEGIPSILHINDSFYYKPDLDGRQDRVLVQSEEIAQSIVHMHITSQLLYKVDQHPAFFCVPNRELDPEGVLTEFKSDVKLALARQKQWFVALVRLADDDWQHMHKHGMISDIQRTAARELGLERQWLLDVQSEEDKTACPFCGSNLLDPTAPICPICGKVHNPVALAELEARMTAPVDPVTGRRG